MIKNNTGENLFRYFYKKKKFLIFDMETENLNLCLKNKPWEIGYILIENNKIIEERNRRIWWEDLNIGEAAARITRFNYQNYKKTAEPAEEILSDFEKLLYDPSIINISYNGLNFDMYIHNLWRKKLGKKSDWGFLSRSIDVLALSRAYKMEMEPPEEWEDFFGWQFKLISYFDDDRLRQARKKGLGSCTLKSMCKHFKIDFDDAKGHEGLYDVGKTWEVFEQLVWKIGLTLNCTYKS